MSRVFRASAVQACCNGSGSGAPVLPGNLENIQPRAQLPGEGNQPCSRWNTCSRDATTKSTLDILCVPGKDGRTGVPNQQPQKAGATFRLVYQITKTLSLLALRDTTARDPPEGTSSCLKHLVLSVALYASLGITRNSAS